ncbi:MAG TPA: hypothetical protein VFE37_24105 [Chloroflexota bacterium]|nr:hypothetical protein [Chloroflexota bacterium]
MRITSVRRTILALGTVAVLALGVGGVGGPVSGPKVAEASVEAHHVAHWAHVPVAFRYFRGANYAYSYDWYFHRHISFPSLYRVYIHEPVGVCLTEYYFYGGVYYCYVG